jgi:hypothetical protein
MTGNRPDDRDYAFCHKNGIMTVEAQQRNASMLDRRDAKRNDDQWFSSSSAFTGG